MPSLVNNPDYQRASYLKNRAEILRKKKERLKKNRRKKLGIRYHYNYQKSGERRKCVCGRFFRWEATTVAHHCSHCEEERRTKRISLLRDKEFRKWAKFLCKHNGYVPSIKIEGIAYYGDLICNYQKSAVLWTDLRTGEWISYLGVDCMKEVDREFGLKKCFFSGFFRDQESEGFGGYGMVGGMSGIHKYGGRSKMYSDFLRKSHEDKLRGEGIMQRKKIEARMKADAAFMVEKEIEEVIYWKSYEAKKKANRPDAVKDAAVFFNLQHAAQAVAGRTANT